MIVLLKYWKLLAVGVLLAVTNLATYRYVHNAWDSEKAGSSLSAVEAARKIESDNAKAANSQAETTRNMEADYAKALEADRAQFVARERSYTDSLRALSNRLGQCRTTTEALGAIVAADGAREREDRLREEVGRDFAEVGQRANELAETVKLCVAWANSVGR